jgi:predicted RNA-binding Zn-ribbon protein involved in translation (DUF1610 family)
MERCPKCKSRKIHRSRTKPGLEKIRKTLTGKAPFRCSDCGWRGWAFDSGGVHQGSNGAHAVGHEGAVDLEAIDRAIREKSKGPSVREPESL